jgi:hypothetical protein
MSVSATILSTCLFCGKPLRGRIDKKFCDTGCKNEHNNRLLREERAAMKPIDMILKHNRRVLRHCLDADHTRVVPGKELLQAGLRLEYYTHHFTNQHSDQYVFCYDYGYLVLPDGHYLVVRGKGIVHQGADLLLSG